MAPFWKIASTYSLVSWILFNLQAAFYKQMIWLWKSCCGLIEWCIWLKVPVKRLYFRGTSLAVKHRGSASAKEMQVPFLIILLYHRLVFQSLLLMRNWLLSPFCHSFGDTINWMRSDGWHLYMLYLKLPSPHFSGCSVLADSWSIYLEGEAKSYWGELGMWNWRYNQVWARLG